MSSRALRRVPGQHGVLALRTGQALQQRRRGKLCADHDGGADSWADTGTLAATHHWCTVAGTDACTDSAADARADVDAVEGTIARADAQALARAVASPEPQADARPDAEAYKRAHAFTDHGTDHLAYDGTHAAS